MIAEQSGVQEYELVKSRFTQAAIAGPALEMAQNIPGIHEIMAEPFDLTNHAGNLWGGTIVAGVTAFAYAKRMEAPENSLVINEEDMNLFCKYAVAGVVGATALINCVTETKWGVKNLPFAEWLHGTTPDRLDALYSAVWGGILSMAFWKKRPSNTTVAELA